MEMCLLTGGVRRLMHVCCFSHFGRAASACAMVEVVKLVHLFEEHHILASLDT